MDDGSHHPWWTKRAFTAFRATVSSIATRASVQPLARTIYGHPA